MQIAALARGPASLGPAMAQRARISRSRDGAEGWHLSLLRCRGGLATLPPAVPQRAAYNECALHAPGAARCRHGAAPIARREEQPVATTDVVPAGDQAHPRVVAPRARVSGGLDRGLPAHWFPIMRSAELLQQSKRLRRFGLELAVWRDAAGRPHVFEDRCPHR